MKRKLSRAEKAAKAARNAEFMTVFINGKQKRVRRPIMVEEMSVEEFVARNADPIWFHQNEMWEDITTEPRGNDESAPAGLDDEEVPF